MALASQLLGSNTEGSTSFKTIIQQAYNERRILIADDNDARGMCAVVGVHLLLCFCVCVRVCVRACVCCIFPQHYKKKKDGQFYEKKTCVHVTFDCQ